MADIPANNSLTRLTHVDLMVLNDSDGRINWKSEGDWKGASVSGGNTYALLREGDKPIDRFNAELQSVGMQQMMYNDMYDVRANKLGYAYWKYYTTKEIVWVTFILGVLVLLVGLLNFFYFQVGAFLNRNREYSLRRVLGCTGKHLLAQLFVQIAITVFLAFLIAFSLIELLASVLHFDFFGTLQFDVDIMVLQKQCAQYLLLILAVCVLVCLFTVAQARRTDIQAGIRGLVGKQNRHHVRNVMMGIQYFICWMFVSLAAALYLQAYRTTSTIFGTLSNKEKSEILSIPLDYPGLSHEAKLALVNRMKEHAGVIDYMLSDISYLKGVSGNGIYPQPPTENRELYYWMNIISVPDNFFRFMNINIEQGHGLTNGNEIVIDRTLAQDFREKNGKDLIGTTLYDQTKAYTVVGIYEAFTTNAYYSGMAPGQFAGCIFMPYSSDGYVGHCYLKCHPVQVNEVREYVLTVLRDALPYTLEPQVTTLLEDVEEAQSLENEMKSIILFLAIVCIIITLLGVYAAITLDTERRQKEVAIRKVNGAGIRQILLLFIRTYIWILGISFCIALPLLILIFSFWKQLYITFFNFGPAFWACILLFVILTTGLTMIFRILKTAHLNPSEALKKE